MDRVEFKGKIVTAIFLIAVVSFMIYVAYHLFENNFILLAFIIPVIMIIGIWKDKLVIQDGKLREERVFRAKEVSLNDVKRIHLELKVKRDMDDDRDFVHATSKNTTKHLYAYDKMDQPIFKCSFEYLSKARNQQIFTETIHSINPDITVDFRSRFEKIKSRLKEEAMKLEKEYREK